MTFLTGTGRHRAQIVYFFRVQIGSRTPSRIGLGSGSRLRRMRPYLELPRELWIENFGGSWSRAIERKGPCLYVYTDGSRRACAVGDCTCIVPTLGDPRDTYWAGIDRIKTARPPSPLAARRPRINNFRFSAPSTCPIALSGPLANGTVLKRLQDASYIKPSMSLA